MATSRIKGTNEQISTYGTGGRDYTSLSVWESATDNNLVSLAESEVLECYNDATFNDSVTMSGAITDSSYFRIIRPAGTIGTGSWQGHDGIADSTTGVFFDNTVDDEAIDCGDAYSSIQDLKIRCTNPTTSNRITMIADGGESSIIGCIIFDCTNTNGSHRGIRVDGNGTSGYYINSFALRTDLWGMQGNGDNAYFYNCNAIDNGNDGFLYSGGVIIAKNCLATGNDAGAGDDFDPGTYTGSTNNASGDLTAPGTSPRISQTFTFINAGAGDYHLSPSDAGAHTFGADLSADGVFPFDDDIDGDTRS